MPPPFDLEIPAKHKRRSGSQKRKRDKGAVLVTLLPEERAAVEEKAATAELSMAAYARAYMLGNAGSHRFDSDGHYAYISSEENG